MIRTRDHDAIYITKDSRPFSKAHSMFTDIRLCLYTIPFKDGPFKSVQFNFVFIGQFDNLTSI